MYQVYVIDETAFNPKKLLGEFSSLDIARARAEKELTRDQDTKYIIEETTGHVDSYGELLTTVVEENL